MTDVASDGPDVLPAPDGLGDDALVAAFDGAGFAPGSFHHHDHVRVAWVLLDRTTVMDTLSRFTSGLRRLAAAAGKPQVYHETITCAYVILVQERRAARGAEDWPAFAARNPDLLAWKPSVLETKYYREDTLWSERARASFVLPDRGLTA
jgi:hypothetical protein